jgi:hypothetical protein
MGSNPISSAGEPPPLGRGLLCAAARVEVAEGISSVPRYWVKVDVEVEADDTRLITVELQGRLMDNTVRPPGVRVENASVVAIHEQPELED